MQKRKFKEAIRGAGAKVQDFLMLYTLHDIIAGAALSF